jgi:putative NADPH-quinone reductase
VLELGKANFDPILRYGYAKRMPKDTFIERSQELIMWADHIVFAFPIWWGDRWVGTAPR